MSVRRIFAAVRFDWMITLFFSFPHLIESLQLNHRKGLHRVLSDAELVSILEYFRKAGVLFVSKNDILARLDFDMGAQLDYKMPILVKLDSIESRYIDNENVDRDEVINKVGTRLCYCPNLNSVFRHLPKRFCVTRAQ